MLTVCGPCEHAGRQSLPSARALTPACHPCSSQRRFCFRTPLLWLQQTLQCRGSHHFTKAFHLSLAHADFACWGRQLSMPALMRTSLLD